MVKVCEVFGCTTTEKDGLCMHKFPKKNVEHRNAWVAWITRNRSGWSLKCNSRVCELHFVPEDYVENTRGNRILRRLKTSAIPSLQVEGIENSENHCNTKTIRRFRQTVQCLKDVTNIPIIVDELESININFFDVSKQLATKKCQKKEVKTFMEASAIHVPELTDVHLNLLDKWEWPIIYDIAEAVIRSIKKVCNTCDVCFNAVLWQGPNNHPYGFVIDLHDYKDNKLYKVSDDCFKAIMKAEITFRQLRDTLKTVTYINLYKHHKLYG